VWSLAYRWCPRVQHPAPPDQPDQPGRPRRVQRGLEDPVGEGALLATKNRSARLTGEVRAARGRLQPWREAPAVRGLDERLGECGLA